jgi:hypothetical protein
MLEIHDEYWQVDYSEKDTCKEIRVQATVFLPIVLKREVNEIKFNNLFHMRNERSFGLKNHTEIKNWINI